MEEASRVRRAAREAVGETVPERLRTHVLRVLDTGSMTPGALVLLSAETAETAETAGSETEHTASSPTPDPDLDTADALATRAAGVQLIYDGLRVTRSLAREEPWTDESRDRIEADLAILAADVLVARGFHLLARTAVAGRAVATVRRFGRDQTKARDVDGDAETDRTSLDRTLEADALELALRCGLTGVGHDVPSAVSAFTADLAEATNGEFPAAADFLSPSVVDSLAAFVHGPEHAGLSEGVSPATDP